MAWDMDALIDHGLTLGPREVRRAREGCPACREELSRFFLREEGCGEWGAVRACLNADCEMYARLRPYPMREGSFIVQDAATFERAYSIPMGSPGADP